MQINTGQTKVEGLTTTLLGTALGQKMFILHRVRVVQGTAKQKVLVNIWESWVAKAAQNDGSVTKMRVPGIATGSQGEPAAATASWHK